MQMTPGPTTVPPRVRDRLGEPMPNPDVEQSFADLYDDLCHKLQRVYDTDDDVVVMGGEGILGLEAAIASTVAPGDDVLCLSNGLYGDGFADFVESYGGEPTLVSAAYTDPIDVESVENAHSRRLGECTALKEFRIARRNSRQDVNFERVRPRPEPPRRKHFARAGDRNWHDR